MQLHIERALKRVRGHLEREDWDDEVIPRGDGVG